MERMALARLVLLVVAVMVPFTVGAETATWTNPTTYTDNTAIPAAKQAALSTEIQYRIPPGGFTTYGIATGGANTFTGAYVTNPGVTSYWRIRAISTLDNNSTSAWSAEFPFVRAYQVPGVPSFNSIQ